MCLHKLDRRELHKKKPHSRIVLQLNDVASAAHRSCSGSSPLPWDISRFALCPCIKGVERTPGNRPVHQEVRTGAQEGKQASNRTPHLLLCGRRNNMSITRDLQHDLQQETRVIIQTPQGWCESPTSTDRFWTHWATQPDFARQHKNWKDWKLLAPCSLQRWEQDYLYKMGI